MDPIRPEIYEKMNAVGRILGETFAPYGFCLLAFDFGGGGFMNYISNANRADMIKALHEFIEKLEND